MISGVEFTLLLMYFAIGIVITISIDVLAALIDEDVYGISDNAPSNRAWEDLLWKAGSVAVSPIVLAVFVGMLVFAAHKPRQAL